MLEQLRLVLAVPDLAASAAYYRDVLGFEIREIGDPGWRFYVRDACTIMAGDCPGSLPAVSLGDHSYVGYMVVSGIDGYYAEVVQRGGDLIKQLRDEPWGMREFGVRTVDGHRLMFGQRLT